MVVENTNLFSKKKQSTFSTLKRKQAIFAWVMLILPVINFILTWVFINGNTVVLAFKDRTNQWTLENFKTVYLRFTDPYEADFWPMLQNTLDYFFVQELFGLPLSFFVSFFIFKKIAGYKFFRVLFYLPNIIPSMVMVIAFGQFVFPGGVLEVLCSKVGITLPVEGLIYNGETAKYTLMVYTLLKTSCGNILFYSAFARIPPELLEAAKIDGVTLFKEFIYIDFPLILPTFTMTLLMDSVSILSAGPPLLEFGAPPGTVNVAYWFFMQVYGSGANGIGNYGIMSALGLAFTIGMLPLVFAVRALAEKCSQIEY